MTFTRSILRSLQKASRSRPLQRTFIHGHNQRGHDLHHTLFAPTSSIFIRSFTIDAGKTTTSTTSLDDNQSTDKKDDQPQDPHSIIKIDDRTSDEVWEEYLQLLNDPTVTLQEYDHKTVCVALKRDKTSPDSVKRIQTLLKWIHEQGTMPDLFVQCCNMLIYLYLEHGALDSAKLVFNGMLRSKYEPTDVTFTSILDGIGKLGTAQDAMTLYKSLSQQGLFPESGDTYHRLIKLLGVDFGDVDSSLMLFTKLQQQNDSENKPDIAIYNTMLTIYQHAKQPERAWAFYSQQILSNVTPNGATFYTLLKTLQRMKNTDTKAERIQALHNDMKQYGVPIHASHYQAMGWDAMEALNQTKKNGSQLTVHDYNILIASAVKNNKFGDALTIFKEMAENSGMGNDMITPDVYTYGIIMDALVKDVEQPATAVFDIYEEMKERQITPDVVVYSCLLQACGRGAHMDRAMNYLEEMQQFKIQPNTYILNTFLGVLSRKPTKERHDLDCARNLWHQMIALRVHPDTRSCNQYLSLLSNFVPKVDPNELKAALQLQDDDDDNLYSNEKDGTSKLMGALAMSGTAKYMLKIYRSMRRRDFLSYSIMINTMVNHGQTRQAMVIFRDAQLANKKLGVNIYNTIMQGLVRDNDLHQVMYVWQDMKAHHVLPDLRSYELVLDACQQLHLVETFKTIMEQRNKDKARLQSLEDEREQRWSRAKSIKERQNKHHDKYQQRDE
ncbi:hypothetical protein BC941DRAFT_507810 [Chlamydoabsidia padenii]|nr:hypothetical protein BC941DRAFT_507810 [Chlamydoabsidia padenii]